MIRYLLPILLLLAAPLAAQNTRVTAIFKTQDQKTPVAAGLKTTASIGTTPVYGSVLLQSVDTGRANQPREITCNVGGVDITHPPQLVTGWIRGDGVLIGDDEVAGVPLVPTEGCSPAGLAYRADIRFNASVSGSRPEFMVRQFKAVPNQTTVDWSTLPVAAAAASVPVIYYQTILDELTLLPQRLATRYTGAGVSCVDNPSANRTDCTITGGGGGGSTHQIDAVDLTAQDPINFLDTAVFDWTNPAAGNLSLAIKANALTGTQIDESTLSGIPQSSVTTLVSDLAAKQPLDADLTAIAALAGTGFARRTAADTWAVAAIADADVPDSITITLAAAATALAADPADCSANQYGNAIAASGALTCAQITFAQLGSTPTTLAGYGITDAQGLDADLTAIAALTRTRGDLLIGGVSDWTELAIGGNLTVLGSDGTDPAWVTLTKAHLPAALAYEDEANVFTAAGGVTLDNQLGLRLRELTANGANYIEHRAVAALAANVVLTWNITGDCTGNVNAGALTINASLEIVCSDDDGGAGGGGDNLRVEDADNAGTFTAMSDADFDDSGDINFVRAAGPPDVLTALIRANVVGPAEIDETAAYAFSSTSNTFVGASFTSAGADPADAGVFRLAYGEEIRWERDTPATDAYLRFGTTAAGIDRFTLSPGSTIPDTFEWEFAGGAVILGFNSDSSGVDRMIFQSRSNQTDVDVFRFGSGLNGTGQCFRLGSAHGDEFVARANVGVAIGAGNENILCSAVTRDLLVVDSIATTGVTQAAIQAGAGQGATDLLQFLNNAGGSLLTVDSGGGLNSTLGTITASNPHLSGTATLNNSGIAFMGLDFNWTLTAAHSGSRFLRYQIAGVTATEIVASTGGFTLTSDSQQTMLQLQATAPGVAGTRDSPAAIHRGASFDTAGHTADWRWQVDVTSNAGASTYRLATRIDAASFADALTVSDAGLLSGASFDFTGHSAIGSDAVIDNAPDSTILTLKDTQTQTTLHAIGISNTLIWAPASNASARNLIGMDMLMVPAPAAGVTIPAAAGISINMQRGSSGQTGTITDFYGIVINPATQTFSSVTNNYGIRILDQNTAGASNWALYTGLGLVRFGDVVTADADLTVNDLLTFAESAGDATCGAGDYWLKGNSASGKLRGCENGSLGDLIGAGGGGDSITINGTAVTDADFDDADPAAATDGLNVKWQLNATPAPDSISAYILMTAITKVGTITAGVWNGTAIDEANLDGNVVLDNASNTWSTGTQDFTGVTALLVKSAAGFAPTADASLGFDSTRDMYVGGGAGITGSFPRVWCTSIPNESLSNSVSTLQDFSSVCTIPANLLAANKVLKVTLGFYLTSGTSSVTSTRHLKLGSTVVFTSNAGNAPDGNTDKSYVYTFYIVGTAAPGASVNVITFIESGGEGISPSTFNNTTQPVALATNGTLTIVPGVTFSGTGGTEILELQFASVQEMN